MALNAAVVTGAMGSVGGGTTDYTSSGFGTPVAAIIIAGSASTTTNPRSGATVSIGFWDGTNQRVMSVVARDALATSSTARYARDDYAVVIGGESASNDWLAGYTVSSITDGIRLTLSVDNTSLSRYATVILLSGVSAKALTFTPNSTQDGTQESASLGFAPLALLALSIGHTGTTANSGSAQTTGASISLGVATQGGTHRMLAWGSEHAAADALVNTLISTTRCAGQVYSDSASWGMEITTWGSDTFTATTRDAASGGDIAFVLALGGADLGVEVGTVTTLTSTGTDTISSSITPKAALIGLSAATAVDSLETTNPAASAMSIGAASATVQAGMGIVDEDAAATTNTETLYSSTSAVQVRQSSSGTGSALIVADVDINASSIDINYTTVSGSARYGWYLAFGAVSGGGTPVGAAAETDTALALSAVQITAAGIALETDTALALSAVQITAAGIALETDAALALDASTPGVIGAASETDTALALVGTQIVPVGVAVESSASLALAAVQAITAGMALEIDAGLPLTGSQWRTVGRADEVDAALGLLPGGSGTGATAAEIWSYTLSNGLTAEATVVAIHTMLSELHLIHGLTAGSPLSVTAASRAAGAVSQAVAEAAGTVTVTRQ